MNYALIRNCKSPSAHSKFLAPWRECATAFFHPWSKHECEKSCLSVKDGNGRLLHHGSSSQ